MEFGETLLIASIPSIVTSIIAGVSTYLVNRNISKKEGEKLQEQNRLDLEQLMNRHKLDIDALEKKHKHEMELKEQEHGFKMAELQKQAEGSALYSVAGSLLSDPKKLKEFAESIQTLKTLVPPATKP